MQGSSQDTRGVRVAEDFQTFAGVSLAALGTAETNAVESVGTAHATALTAITANAGATGTKTVTVTGAASATDFAFANVTAISAGLVLTGVAVTGANTVTLIFTNITGSNITTGTCTVNVAVVRP